MITTTIDVSAIADLGKRFVTLQQADTLLRNICSGMLPTTRERIHEFGKKADGSDIGQYSDSYLKLRQSEGLPSDKVYLFYSGDLQNQYNIIPLDDKSYGLGWDNKFQADKAEWLEDGRKASAVGAHDRKLKSGKVVKVKSYNRAGTKGYGQVWALTQEELDGVRAIVQDFIQRNFE